MAALQRWLGEPWGRSITKNKQEQHQSSTKEIQNLLAAIEPHEHHCSSSHYASSGGSQHKQLKSTLSSLSAGDVRHDAVDLRLRQGQLQKARSLARAETQTVKCTSRHLMRQEHGVAFNDLRKSLCAADARGAQRGCDGPPRRRGNKPGTGEQRHKLRHVIFVLEGDRKHAANGRAA